MQGHVGWRHKLSRRTCTHSAGVARWCRRSRGGEGSIHLLGLQKTTNSRDEEKLPLAALEAPSTVTCITSEASLSLQSLWPILSTASERVNLPFSDRPAEGLTGCEQSEQRAAWDCSLCQSLPPSCTSGDDRWVRGHVSAVSSSRSPAGQSLTRGHEWVRTGEAGYRCLQVVGSRDRCVGGTGVRARRHADRPGAPPGPGAPPDPRYGGGTRLRLQSAHWSQLRDADPPPRSPQLGLRI